MTHLKLMKAIVKAGLTAKVAETNSNMFRVEGPNRIYGTFFVQGDSAICVSTCFKGDSPDAMTDYFPQRFHDSIKGFIASMGEV